jgi:hypothetical protein
MALPEGPHAVEPQTSLPIPNSHTHRPLEREGACYFLSAAEQAMEDAMLRSSPPPETMLGKRTRQGGDDGNIDTEPDEDPPSTPQQPSFSSVADASRRYALKKSFVLSNVMKWMPSCW